MPKTTPETTALLTSEVGRFLDGLGSRVFDGHLVVDFAADAKIGGRILHAHDQSELATFTLAVTTS